MISKLSTVIPNKLFRGGAPSLQDILWLKNNLDIKKIISLDQEVGNKISRICKLLGIKQIIIPLNEHRHSLLNLFQYNLKKLLLTNGPTFVHCYAGKDRTGFVIALFKCKYLNMDSEKALREAKSFGFGINIPDNYKNIIKQYEKLIRLYNKKNDVNNVDIVSNQREYISDNRSSFLDESHQGSFAPYLSVTRQYPYDYIYNEIDEQSPTRENYNRHISEIDNKTEIPQVGNYNNSAGMFGAGPAFPSGGFLSE